MKADKEVRIIARLLEVKTELQEKVMNGMSGATKRLHMAEIRGLDKAIEIVRKEFADE